MRGRIAAALLGLTCIGSVAGGDIVGRASVIDADTLEIQRQRIRLLGIDAVESDQRCMRDGATWACGREAAMALADRLGSRTVSCRGSARDSYDRTLAHCFIDDVDIGEWLLLQGWAVVYRKSAGAAYVAAEASAKHNRAGIWAGTFERPDRWRASKRRMAKEAASRSRVAPRPAPR